MRNVANALSYRTKHGLLVADLRREPYRAGMVYSTCGRPVIPRTTGSTGRGAVFVGEEGVVVGSSGGLSTRDAGGARSAGRWLIFSSTTDTSAEVMGILPQVMAKHPAGEVILPAGRLALEKEREEGMMANGMMMPGMGGPMPMMSGMMPPGAPSGMPGPASAGDDGDDDNKVMVMPLARGKTPPPMPPLRETEEEADHGFSPENSPQNVGGLVPGVASTEQCAIFCGLVENCWKRMQRRWAFVVLREHAEQARAAVRIQARARGKKQREMLGDTKVLAGRKAALERIFAGVEKMAKFLEQNSFSLTIANEGPDRCLKKVLYHFKGFVGIHFATELIQCQLRVHQARSHLLRVLAEDGRGGEERGCTVVGNRNFFFSYPHFSFCVGDSMVWISWFAIGHAALEALELRMPWGSEFPG